VSTAIKVLVIEDSKEDAELTLRLLRRGGFDAQYERVDTAAATQAALERQTWDAVISDFSMRGFTGLDALSLVRAADPDIPFILISGTIGEETAVEAMKAGASDYVMKGNLARLAPALERELAEAALRAERRQAQRDLIESEAGLHRAQLMANLAHIVTGPDGSFESWSQSVPALIGVPAAGMPKSTREWLDFVHPDDRAIIRAKALEGVRTGKRIEFAYRLKSADGSWIHINQVSEPLDATRDARGKLRWFGTLQDVTKQRRTAEALQASEERYRAMFEKTAVGIAHADLSGHFMTVNPKFCEISGYSEKEALSLHFRDLTHLDDLQQSEMSRDRLLAGNSVAYEIEARLVRKDSSHVWASITTSLVRGADGEPLHFISVLHDVTERKAAERERQALLERDGAIARSLAEIVYDWRPLTDELLWSGNYTGTLGYNAEEMGCDTHSWTGRVHPDDLDEVLAEVKASVGERRLYDLEYRFRHHDGSYVWMHDRGVPFVDAGGQLLRIIGVFRDISARKRAEEVLQRFRLALDNSADMILIIDRATMRHVDINQAACRLLGYTQEELLNLGPQDLLPVSQSDLEKAYDELIANPDLRGRLQSYYRCKDGSQLPFESTRHVLRSGDRWLIAVISRDIRERLASETALRESEARFRSLSELSSDWFWEQDAEHRFVAFSGGEGVQGWGPDQPAAVGLRRWELPTIAPVSGNWDEHKAVLEAHLPFRNFEYQRLLGDGKLQYVAASGVPLFDASGRFAGYRGVATDITGRKESERRITRLNRVYAVLSGINAAIVRIRDRDELFKEACRVAVEDGGFRMAWLGVVDREAMRVKPVAWQGVGPEYIQLMPVGLVDTGPEGRGLAGRVVVEGKAIVIDDMTQDKRILLRSEARERGFRSLVMLPLIVADEVTGVLALYAGETGFFDEGEMKLLQELAGDISFACDHIEKANRLDYLAYYDSLTGLANRTLFHERLAQHIHAAGVAKCKLAVVVADIERFRMVNDSLGRQAGDSLLKQLAHRLVQAVGPSEVARIGSDQFAVVLLDVKGRSGIGRTIEGIWRSCLDEHFSLNESELHVAMKGGVALFPNDGADADTVFRNAEAAWKKAKRTGERYLFHAQEMTAGTAEKLTLESSLRQALEKEEFVLHYQPKVELEQRRIVGVEALIRWQRPERGLVPPGQFIPLLEETGLILQVGAWALQRAVCDHAQLHERGVPAPRIAVNVSALQLRQRDFVDVVKEAIAHGADPTAIDVEITESLLMEDVAGNIKKLKALRDLGMKISIDDFGTGYSSLGYLAQLPVHTLKIDRSFIMKMVNDPNAMTLVQTIISLAHSLRLSVVAEGVEQEEQAKLLCLLRCDEMQGYLFSKPIPMEQLTPLLRDSK
jgi:PAS domain S-box-containing protein/diguanylate cyclase (GGDEF)-like protein